MYFTSASLLVIRQNIFLHINILVCLITGNIKVNSPACTYLKIWNDNARLSLIIHKLIRLSINSQRQGMNTNQDLKVRHEYNILGIINAFLDCDIMTLLNIWVINIFVKLIKSGVKASYLMTLQALCEHGNISHDHLKSGRKAAFDISIRCTGSTNTLILMDTCFKRGVQ